MVPLQVDMEKVNRYLETRLVEPRAACLKCSVTISVPFGHFGAIRLKGYAKTLHKLTLFEIP